MKVLKWIGIVLGGLVGLLVVAVLVLSIYGNMKWKPTLKNRPLYPITADTSAAGQARGKYLMEGAMDCTHACHTPEGGQAFIGTVENISQGPVTAVFAPPNLTSDVETGLGGWADAEIARAIREGVDKNGVGLVIMPSHTFHNISDADIAAIVGYLRNIAPVRNEIPSVDANLFGKILNALGAFGPASVGEPITTEIIKPQPGTVENGKYLIAIGGCRDCHQQNLGGGAVPFSDPSVPMAANLTPSGELPSWSADDFVKAVQQGMTPYGKTLHEYMPRFGTSAEDLKDIFAYLQTLPPAEK